MTSSTRGAVAAPGRAESDSRSGVWLTELLLFSMALIWGINFSVVKGATLELAPLAFNSMRVALAAAALLLIAAGRRREWPSRRDTLALLGLGVLGNCVYQVFFIEGIARTQAGTAALILGASPAIIAMMGRVGGVERVSARTAAGIGLSIVGVGLVMFGDPASAGGSSSLLGNALVFAGSVGWAAFTVLVKPYTHRVPGLQLSAITMTGGALPLLLIGAPALAETRWGAISAGAWGGLAYSGIAALVVAYIIWYRGVRVIGPTRTAMYGNLQPFIALIVAWLAFGDVPTSLQAAGAGGIMTGILLTRG
jgi:drug/metabolite transporter (DMT)-like permease